MNRPNHLRAVSDSPWNDPRSYAPDLYDTLETDTRVRQLRLEVSPRIGWFSLVVMSLVAAAIGFWLAVGAS